MKQVPRLAVIGFGRLGRACARVIMVDKNLELAGIIRRADSLGEKLPEPTVCTKCRVLFQASRWTWEAAPLGAYTTICPACQRVEDDFPASH